MLYIRKNRIKRQFTLEADYKLILATSTSVHSYSAIVVCTFRYRYSSYKGKDGGKWFLNREKEREVLYTYISQLHSWIVSYVGARQRVNSKFISISVDSQLRSGLRWGCATATDETNRRRKPRDLLHSRALLYPVSKASARRIGNIVLLLTS